MPTCITFTAAATGGYTMSLCGGSTWDTRIAVLNTCDPANGVVACNDDSCGLQSNTIATLTAGSILLMWIGELITERGIGNGISFIIFAGIVARLPNGIFTFLGSPDIGAGIAFALLGAAFAGRTMPL